MLSGTTMSSSPPTFLILGGVAQGTASTVLTYLWDHDSSSSSGGVGGVSNLLSGSKKQRRASYIRLCVCLSDLAMDLNLALDAFHRVWPA